MQIQGDDHLEFMPPLAEQKMDANSNRYSTIDPS